MKSAHLIPIFSHDITIAVAPDILRYSCNNCETVQPLNTNHTNISIYFIFFFFKEKGIQADA